MFAKGWFQMDPVDRLHGTCYPHRLSGTDSCPIFEPEKSLFSVAPLRSHTEPATLTDPFWSQLRNCRLCSHWTGAKWIRSETASCILRMITGKNNRFAHCSSSNEPVPERSDRSDLSRVKRTVPS